MDKFDVTKLNVLTRGIYDSYINWNDKNWKSTLKANHKKIEKLLTKIQIFDKWANELDKHSIAKGFLQEIYMDALISIHFSCMGLYKSANVSLRAELENTLRFIYFSSHPVEFKWWSNDLDWYRKIGGHVWGKEYNYFENFEETKKFDYQTSKKLFDEVGKIYGKLSRYVHTGFKSFQTSGTRISPTFKKDEFKKWVSNFNEVQNFVNTFLILFFPEDFKKSDAHIQRKVLKVIENKDYKKRIKKSLNLRLRGRI